MNFSDARLSSFTAPRDLAVAKALARKCFRYRHFYQQKHLFSGLLLIALGFYFFLWSFSYPWSFTSDPWAYKKLPMPGDLLLTLGLLLLTPGLTLMTPGLFLIPELLVVPGRDPRVCRRVSL